jgi:hypothetical protein
MNQLLPRLLFALVLPAALVATACAGPRTVAVDEWVAGLCRAAAAYDTATDATADRFANVDFTDTAKAKETFASAITEQRQAQETFRSAFGDLGQPDIDGGKQVVEAFKAQFKENDERMGQIAERVAAIPDTADFLPEFLRIADELGEPEFRPRLEAVAANHSPVNDLIAAIDAERDCARTIFNDDPAASPEGEAWVSGVCTALGDWVAAINEGAEALNRDVDLATEVEGVQRALVDFFERGLADTRTLERDLRQLSPPPIADGEAIHRVFTNAGEDLVAAMERLARDARAADFASVVQAEAESKRFQGLIEQLFGDVAASFDELQQYDPEGLDQLFQTLPECQF